MRASTFKIAVVLATVALGASAAEPQEESLWDKYLKASAEVSIYSAYVWRGQVLVPNPVWQPAANLFLNVGEHAEYGYFKLRAWANFMIERNRAPREFAAMSIVDETVSYNVTFFDCLDFEAGGIFYQFPTRHDDGLRDTDEFLVGCRYRNPILMPSFYIWWDYGQNGHNDTDSLYFDFNFTHAFRPIDRLTVTPGTGFGLGNDSYLDHYSRGDVRHAAFTNVHLDLIADYALTDWLHLGASISYFFYPSSHVRESSYIKFDRYEDGILRGGAHLKIVF